MAEVTVDDNLILEIARGLALSERYIHDKRVMGLIDGDLEFAWRLAKSCKANFWRVMEYLAENQLCTHHNFRKMIDIAIDNWFGELCYHDLRRYWHFCLSDILYWNDKYDRQIRPQYLEYLQDPAEVVAYLAVNNMPINSKYCGLNSPHNESCTSKYLVFIGEPETYMTVDQMYEYMRFQHLPYYAKLKFYCDGSRNIIPHIERIDGVGIEEFMVIWEEFREELSSHGKKIMLKYVNATFSELRAAGFNCNQLRYNKYVDPVEYVNTMPSSLSGEFTPRIEDEIKRRYVDYNRRLIDYALGIITKKNTDKIAADVFSLIIFHCDDYIALDDSQQS